MFISEIYWGDETNRRIFFDEIACEGEFEPLVPENWYWLPRTSVTERKVYPLSYLISHLPIIPSSASLSAFSSSSLIYITGWINSVKLS